MKILVTGATGFIGLAVAARLEAAGHEVTAISLRDLRMRDYVPPDLAAQYDVVVHCAWGGVKAADRDSMAIQQENFEMFRWLLGILRHRSPDLFISFGSQAEIYHQNSAYARAKSACEELLFDFAQTTHVRTAWLRLFSVYGPGEGDSWLIPSITRKLLRNEPIDLTPGEQEMDYLNVRDVASAVSAVIHSSATGKYEVGTGHPVKLRDLVQTLHSITGSSSVLNFGALPYRADQIMRACANPNEFNADTGWSPTVEFTAGLREVVDKIRQDSQEKQDL